MQEVSFHAMLRMSRVSFLCTNVIEVYGGCKSCKYMMTQGKKNHKVDITIEELSLCGICWMFILLHAQNLPS